MQKKNFKPKEDKAKHGLMIRAKIASSFFFALECEGFPGGRRRKREENNKEKRRRKEEEI